jgi:RimJ/RimL family protein N-acetyltransferase
MRSERQSPPTVSREALLADGTTVHVRSLTSADRTGLGDFFSRLSPESRRQRFLSSMPKVSDTLLDRLATVDGSDSIAVVAERCSTIVGVGRANRTDGDAAEVAFTVSDELQGHGVGTLLLEALAHEAHTVGFTRFVAMTRSDNSAMLRVFRTIGFRTHIHHDPDDASVMLIDIEINEQDPHFVSAHHERADQAEFQKSLLAQSLLAPDQPGEADDL